MTEEVDVLAIGAHPDDIEFCCGGTLAQLVARGRRVGLVDLSLGELGTRGTVEARRKEAQKAGEILGVRFRTNLGLPDGEIRPDAESRNQLIRLFRACRPGWILSHSAVGHPDHWNTAVLIREAVHHAGLAKLEPEHPRHRPGVVASWLQFDSRDRPDVVVDISETIEIKEKAILAHASQLHDPQSEEPDTILTDAEFLDRVRAHNRFMGSLADCRFGEGFLLSRVPRVRDLDDV